MKAITQSRYGSPDVLQFDDVDEPTLGDEEVLLSVHAAGVDRGVWHLMTGLPYLMRALGFGLSAPKQRVPGMDVAGRVLKVGRAVHEFHEGDAVFGTCTGAFAERACARADSLAHMPANLSFEEAAAVPTSAMTALQALRDVAAVEEGDSVLVIGAGGGVGTFAVQLARTLGARVSALCSTRKVELVQSLGASEIIDYTRGEPEVDPRRYDIVLDIAGNRSLAELRRMIKPTGTLVIVGGEGGGRWLGGVDRQLRALVLSPFVEQDLRPMLSTPRKDDLLYLRDLIERGSVQPVVERVYPLYEASAALRQLERGHVAGKLVVSA